MCFIEESKTQTSIVDFLLSSDWSKISDQDFHSYKSRVEKLIQHFSKFLIKREEKYKKDLDRDEKLRKTAKNLRKRYSDRNTKTKLVELF